MDYGKEVTFFYSEAEDQPTSKLLEVSEKIRAFLTERKVHQDGVKWEYDVDVLLLPPTQSSSNKNSQLDSIMKLEASFTNRP